MPWHQVLLEYLKVLLQWPPMAALITGVLLLTYRHQIRALLSGATRIRLPGGSEVTITQAARTELALSSPAPSAPLPGGTEPPLPEGLHLSTEQAKGLENILRAHRAESFLWEYRYLNYFLVRHTQDALDWIAGVPQPTTFRAFEAFWMDRIPDPSERLAVLSALEKHHLIQRSVELLQVTDKGREYLKWRGPLPELPESPAPAT